MCYALKLMNVLDPFYRKKAGLEEIRCEATPARLNSNEARFRLRDCK